MKVKINNVGQLRRRGFSFVDAVVAAAILGLTSATVFFGISTIVSGIQFDREQDRATQIMVEKLDAIRLYAWQDLTTTIMPTNFQASFCTDCELDLTYNGTVEIEDSPGSEGYSSRLKKVTVTLDWQSGTGTNQAQLHTLVSEYGTQSNFTQ